jgi:hypothetical protein
MPFPRGISALVESIEDRIEVSGHAPTWRVTGGSFESALSFARAAYDDPVVLERSDHHRFWPRVTLTVTQDPALAAGAPPLEELVRPRIPEQPRGAHERIEAAAPPVLLALSLEELFLHPATANASWVTKFAPVVLVVLSSLAVGLSVLAFLVYD